MNEKAAIFARSAILLIAAITLPVSNVSAQDKAKDAKAAPAAKAEKGKAITTVLVDNDKVLVYETRFKPGDENPAVGTGFRVVRTLQGGTLARVYPDGRNEKFEIKAGRTVYNEPPKSSGERYLTKNVGKTEILQYVVMLKEGIKK